MRKCDPAALFGSASLVGGFLGSTGSLATGGDARASIELVVRYLASRAGEPVSAVE